MTVDELKVLIAADIKQFKKPIKEATSVTKQFAKDVTKQTQEAASGFKTLGSVVKYVVTGVIIKEAIRGISAVTSLASSVVENENLFSEAMGSMANEARVFSNELADALGLNAYGLRQNIGLLNNMAESIGVVKDVAYLTSTNITQLSHDMASFFNKNQTETYQSLIRGLTGEGESLKSNYGVIVNETTTMQTALKHGIITVGQTMTEQQKYIARYITIMESTKKAHNDLARTIDSPANQFRILTNNFKMAGKALGDFFLPFVKVATPYVTALTLGVKDLFTTMANWSRALFGIEEAGQQAGEATESAYGTALNTISDAVNEAKKAVSGFDEINNLSSSGSNEAQMISTSLGIELPTLEIPEAVKTKAEEIKEMFSGWWNSEEVEPYRETLVNIGNTLGNLFTIGKNVYDEFIKPFIAPAVRFAFKGIGKGLEFISGVLETVTSWIAKVDWEKWSPLLFGIAGALAAVYIPSLLINGIIKPLIGGWETIALKFLYAGDSLKKLTGLFSPTILVIGALIAVGVLLWKNWDTIKVKAIEIWSSIRTFIDTQIQSFKESFPGLYDALTVVTKGFSETLTGIFDGIKLTFGGLISFITGVFTLDWALAWEGVKMIFKGIFDTLWLIVRTPLNLIIKGINWLIEKINTVSFTVPDWIPFIGGNSWGFSINPLDLLPTHLARGGIITKPTFAKMGEGYKKEMVVPLENTSFVDKLASALGSAVLAAMNVGNFQTAAPSTGGDIVLTIDGREFARVTNPYLVKEEKRLGRTKVIEKR